MDEPRLCLLCGTVGCAEGLRIADPTEDAHDPYTDDLDAWFDPYANDEWDSLGGDPLFWGDLQDFPEPERIED